MASLRDILVGSAVGGFGLSAGRDAYKKLSRNIGLIIAAIVLAGGTAYGVWNLVRGHARPSLFRMVGCVFLIVLSTVATYFVIVVAGGSAKPSPLEAGILALEIQIVVAVAAAAIGALQRPKRLRQFAVGEHNAAFLNANGLRDVGGRDQTMIDALGNELMLEDQRLDAIIFRVPGRRGARARINLDADGRMTGYVPPQ